MRTAEGRGRSRRRTGLVPAGALVLALVAAARGAEPVRAGEASAATVTIYDQGFALVQELRRVSLRDGENTIVFGDMPRTLDPATTSFSVVAGARSFALLEQAFAGGAGRAPELTCVAKAGDSGMASLRLSYRAEGLGWAAAHEVALDEGATQARFSTRIALRNDTGRNFDRARVKVVLTERGATPGLPLENGSAGPVAVRHVAGGAEKSADRLVAGLGPVQTYELPEPVDLPDAATKYVPFCAADRLPVRRVFIYDGVRFDRFQRNRVTDRNYGTECHHLVESFVEFDNDAGGGLGRPLPPGSLRLMLRRSGDVMDFLGETVLAPVEAGSAVRARVGPARGWRGERERTGYAEIVPAREYEESFVIRIANGSEEAAVIRVVEHLYRSADFEIVKADTEYRKTGPRIIEFSPEIKAGGHRNIHYTVHYRW